MDDMFVTEVVTGPPGRRTRHDYKTTTPFLSTSSSSRRSPVSRPHLSLARLDLPPRPILMASDV
ncbi:hypothetical protein MUK42_33856 [Musa troglodytarum]|uniref:Uncharacterized protein n=1 Tax=Musa troglodytarum TaxID=320322 RepID=A0A9E7KKK7_9LILI|nr:hypothetical protein MUK42_33856 [Musa troglodytarum]